MSTTRIIAQIEKIEHELDLLKLMVRETPTADEPSVETRGGGGRTDPPPEDPGQP